MRREEMCAYSRVKPGAGRAKLFRRLRHGHVETGNPRRPRQPAVEKCLQPGAFDDVMDCAIGEVMVAFAGARQRETFVAARGPAMHHSGGHVGMKLEAERMVEAERFDREVASLRQQFAPGWQIKTLAMPMIDVIR